MKSLLQKSPCFQDNKIARRHTAFYHFADSFIQDVVTLDGK